MQWRSLSSLCWESNSSNYLPWISEAVAPFLQPFCWLDPAICSILCFSLWREKNNSSKYQKKNIHNEGFSLHVCKKWKQEITKNLLLSWFLPEAWQWYPHFSANCQKCIMITSSNNVLENCQLESYLTIYLVGGMSLWNFNLRFLLITESALAPNGLPWLK